MQTALLPTRRDGDLRIQSTAYMSRPLHSHSRPGRARQPGCPGSAASAAACAIGAPARSACRSVQPPCPAAAPAPGSSPLASGPCCAGPSALPADPRSGGCALSPQGPGPPLLTPSAPAPPAAGRCASTAPAAPPALAAAHAAPLLWPGPLPPLLWCHTRTCASAAVDTRSRPSSGCSSADRLVTGPEWPCAGALCQATSTFRAMQKA